MANLPLTEIVVPGSQDVLELAPDLSAEVSALQSAVNTLNTEVSSIPNGTYPNLTAGSILTDKYDTDTAPYLYRALPYKSKRLEDCIVGGSVVWNQLVPNSGSASVTVPSGHKYFSNIGGTKTIAISNGSAISATGGTDNIFDLTQMFGSTIADYVYSLEQATAGNGIAWLKSYGFFTKPYYEYDAGILKSVTPTAHKTVGVNQWDEEYRLGFITAAGVWVDNLSGYFSSKNPIQVLPNTEYNVTILSGGNNAVYYSYYDASGVFIERQTLNLSSGKRILTTPSNAHYMNFSTEAFYGTTYKNDICINISDPTINGKYFPYEEHTYPLGDVTLRGIPKLVNNELIYDGDTYTHDGAVQRNTIFRAYQAGDESLANALTDGTNTVVYSANASTETADTFEQYQICTTGGTEEYTTTNDVPVGHDTKYFTDVIGNIEDIPAPPTADGTYTLKVTVSSGVPTYAWV